MKIRIDALHFSGALFTAALISGIPGFWEAARTDDPLFQSGGFASLAHVLVGLIVTWMGFVKGLRWAWWVMFVIVAVWAFPLCVLPLLQHHLTGTLADWLSVAWQRPCIARSSVLGVTFFAVLVIALFLPLKSFIRSGKSD